MRMLSFIATLVISFGAVAVSGDNAKSTTSGTAKNDEKYLDELKTIKSAPARDRQNIDYNTHTYSGENSQTYSKEDDQQRMEEAHKYLQKQKVREGSAKGTNQEAPTKVWPQEH